MAYISKFKLKDQFNNTILANVVDRVAQDGLETLKTTVSEMQTDITNKYNEIVNRFSYTSSSENLTIK